MSKLAVDTGNHQVLCRPHCLAYHLLHKSGMTKRLILECQRHDLTEPTYLEALVLVKLVDLVEHLVEGSYDARLWTCQPISIIFQPECLPQFQSYSAYYSLYRNSGCGSHNDHEEEEHVVTEEWSPSLTSKLSPVCARWSSVTEVAQKVCCLFCQLLVRNSLHKKHLRPTKDELAEPSFDQEGKRDLCGAEAWRHLWCNW